MVVAREGAEGDLKAKLFPNIAITRGQTVNPSAFPSNEQRKLGSDLSFNVDESAQSSLILSFCFRKKKR